jgi:very-short-patch-repair endonuclease
VTEAAFSAELAAAGVTVGGVCAEIIRSEGLLHKAGDPAVSVLAERQSGVVSRAQLLAAGVGQGGIERRVRRGRLHRVHRGVYAVGHRRLTPRGHVWGALLACGGPEVAVLSHRSAAAVWDLLPSPAKFDVTTLRAAHPKPGIRVHRSRTLRPADVTYDNGLPVTTVARTLGDLATTLDAHRLERVVHRAEQLRVLDAAAVRTSSSRALRDALRTLVANDPDITRSKLEERFLSLLSEARLPRPEVNAMIGPYEVDFLWRDRKLVVETDGAGTHLTPQAFEDDRRRDAELMTLGYGVVRFTRRQVVEQPRATLATLVLLLADCAQAH